MTNYQKWDQDYLALARFWADLKSKDPSTKVGAVVVDVNNKVAGMGYNGFPAGVDDAPERLNDRPTKYQFVVHAEANALITAGNRSQGGTLYSTMACCCDCSKLIIQSGIARVVAPLPDADRWDDSHKAAETMFKEAGVAVYYV